MTNCSAGDRAIEREKIDAEYLDKIAAALAALSPTKSGLWRASDYSRLKISEISPDIAALVSAAEAKRDEQLLMLQLGLYPATECPASPPTGEPWYGMTPTQWQQRREIAGDTLCRREEARTRPCKVPTPEECERNQIKLQFDHAVVTAMRELVPELRQLAYKAAESGIESVSSFLRARAPEVAAKIDAAAACRDALTRELDSRAS